VWEHWYTQRLPLPAAITVSGVNGKKIDVTGHVEIPLSMDNGRLVRSGLSRGQSWCCQASSKMISSKRKGRS
jgi:hypothetical protein